jgi:hypothetical protein
VAWHDDPDLVTAFSRLTEVPVVELKRPIPEPGEEAARATWGIGVDGAPSVVMVRETEDGGLDVSVDWFSLSARTIGTLEGEPAAYVAGTVGLGMTVGAVLGRSGKAAAAGAVVGGLLGLWSQVKGRS